MLMNILTVKIRMYAEWEGMLTKLVYNFVLEILKILLRLTTENSFKILHRSFHDEFCSVLVMFFLQIVELFITRLSSCVFCVTLS